jgi:hypothetical protein
LHLGAGVLPIVENPPHDDFGSLGLVIVDDVLLHPDATATGEDIVP